MGIVATALRKVRSATTFSVREIFLIAPVFVALGLARLAILILPFRVYARVFGQQGGLEVADVPASDRDMARARSVGRIVRRTAHNTPWASLCLAQAMVAAVLLRGAGISFCAIFGLAPGGADESDPLAAHVWVRVGDYNVTGGQDVRRFTVVKVFQNRARRGC